MDDTLKSRMADSAVERLFSENKTKTLQVLTVLKALQTTIADHKNLVQESTKERALHARQMSVWDDLATRLSEVVYSYEENAGAHMELMDATKSIVQAHGIALKKIDAAVVHAQSLIPKKGDPGKDATPVDTEALVSQITDILRTEMRGTIQPESPKELDTEALYKEFVARIQKDKAIDVSHIRNGQQFLFNGKKYKTEELMHGGGSSSNASGTAVYNEVVSGAGTAWILAFTPIPGTVRLYGEGQKLLPTSNYSISGVSITTNDSWPAGAISADYNK